jgi:hypothetical protein
MQSLPEAGGGGEDGADPPLQVLLHHSVAMFIIKETHELCTVLIYYI